jgi:CheY-like chemotaxis protein
MLWSRRLLFILMRWSRRFVDDNAGVRRLLRREFLDSAIAIWECADGADALAAYADRQPDIVLMDVRMPRMDGLAATRQIREFYPGARVVIVTDYDDEDLRKAALEAGAHGHVLKQNLTDIGRLLRLIIGNE